MYPRTHIYIYIQVYVQSHVFTYVCTIYTNAYPSYSVYIHSYLPIYCYLYRNTKLWIENVYVRPHMLLIRLLSDINT